MDYESGVYETIYGNAVEYEAGNDYGYDLDMGEEVPMEMIDFTLYIRSLED